MKRVDLNYVHKKKIDFSEYVGDDFYIVVREPSTKGYLALSKAQAKGEDAIYECINEQFSDYILEHNMFEEDGKLTSNKDVMKIVTDDFQMFQRFMTEYAELINPSEDVKKS